MLQRQPVICFEEELSYATRPTTPFTNPVYLRYRSFNINENPSFVKAEVADGRRTPSRKEIVAKAAEFSLEFQAHPKLLGWFLKWGVGQQLNPATGQFQYTPVEINVEQKSFSMYVDQQVPDFWGDGEDTAYLIGCKVGHLRFEASGATDDHTLLVTVEGVGQRLYGDAVNVITGIPALHYARTLLYNSANPTSFLFKNQIVNWDGAGYSSGNNWRRFAVDLVNELDPVTYSDESANVYISAINTLGQTITCEFDQDLAASSLLDDWVAGTDRDLKQRITHATAYNAGGDKYRVLFDMPRFNIDDANPVLMGAGGTAKMEKTYTGEALTNTPTTDVDNTSATGTDHTLVVATAGQDLEANKFTTSSGGYLCYVTLKLKTDGSGTTENLVAYIYTDDGAGDPDTLVAGGTSNTFKANKLTTSFQTIPFFFPNHPKLDASTDYHIVIGSTGAGSGTVIADGDTAGSNTHTASTDGGSTWAVNDNDDWGYTVEVDEIALAVEYYSDGSYPDAA